MTVQEIIQIAEMNHLNKIKVPSIDGIDRAEKLILAGPQGPIEIIFDRYLPYWT